MKKANLYTLNPQGYSSGNNPFNFLRGGRAYLKMVIESIPESFSTIKLTDYKRFHSSPRWSKARHFVQILKDIPFNDNNGYFLWDDLSVIAFSKEMLSRTIYIIHDYDPLTFDSGIIELFMFKRLFQVLRYCHTVVCVSPYWKQFLAQKGINSHIIYNSIDLELIDSINELDKEALKNEFGLPKDKINVYIGNSQKKLKGVEALQRLLSQYEDLYLFTTGKSNLSLKTNNYFLQTYQDYLKIIRSCDIAVFNSEVKEGWTRSAAEAILLQIPCLINPNAGLGDLALAAHQPTFSKNDFSNLHNMILDRVKASREELVSAYQDLSRFNRNYFRQEWSFILNKLIE